MKIYTVSILATTLAAALVLSACGKEDGEETKLEKEAKEWTEETKELGSAAAEATMEAAQEAADATREAAEDAGEKTKELYEGAKDEGTR
jgi:hypothetical protein